MSEKLQVILFFTSVLGFIGIINLIRLNTLELKYSLIWLWIATFSICLSVFPNILIYFSEFLGFQLPVNALFLIGFYILLVILVMLSIIVSKNTQRAKVLNQELAILKMRVELLEDSLRQKQE